MVSRILIACAAVLLTCAGSATAQERLEFESEGFADLSADDLAQITEILAENGLLAEDQTLVIPDSPETSILPAGVGSTVGVLGSWSEVANVVTFSAAQSSGSAACISTCSAAETAAFAACGALKGVPYIACLAAVVAASSLCQSGCWFISN